MISEPDDAFKWCTPDTFSLLVNGGLGGWFFILGALIARSLVKQKLVAQRLLGPETKVVDATILALTRDKVGDEECYYCSYMFSVERADGVMCRVDVMKRDIPKEVWRAMSEGDVQPVHYMPDDPCECKLTNVGEVESYLCRCHSVLYIFIAFTFMIAGIISASGTYCAPIPYGVAGFLGGMAAGIGVIWWKGVFTNTDVKLTELEQSSLTLANYGSVATPPQLVARPGFVGPA